MTTSKKFPPQGATIKPLVNVLNIDKEEEEGDKLLLEEFNDSVLNAITGGINHVIGRYGYSYFVTKFNQFDENYMGSGSFF